ncbi:MAG: ASCH domain-containing protein [Nanoarchaeota archaeon]|nr:ASCH domain-containing protein [Nanoarchaeota archaeon]
MKTIKFAQPLIPLILSRQKSTTWRINDEKDLTVGETIDLLNALGEKFGQAEILNVKDTKFDDLNSEDKEGHESFLSDEDMYNTYSRYYSFRVVPETKLKIIKFKLLK